MRKLFALGPVFAKAKAYVLAHKAVTAIVLVAAAGVGYGVTGLVTADEAEASYVFAEARRGALVSTISGSGQVAARSETAVTSAAASDVTSVAVKAGDTVTAGQVLARLDSRNAQKAVDNAALSLENAKIAYERALRESSSQAAGSDTSDLVTSYRNGYNVIANASIDLPAIFAGVNDIFYVPSHSPYFSETSIAMSVGNDAVRYKLQAGVTFDAAKREYERSFAAMKALRADSPPEEIKRLLATTDSVLRQLLSAITGAYTTIDYVQDKMHGTIPSEVSRDKTVLSGYVSKVNSNLAAVASARTAIDDAQDSPATAELDAKSAELSVRQATDALDEAREALADHTIRAPYAGVVAKVSVERGDKVSAGAAIATVVTREQKVNIALNEIDAAKVSVGNGATLTFDAIDGLTLPGHVEAIDVVGTVSQGVVSYNVVVAFDKVDPRVKPGMTTSADIVTLSKQGVITVPTGAVRTARGQSFIQVEGENGEPVQRAVTLGATSDTAVEVAAGLEEGERVLVRTVTANVAGVVSGAPTILNSFGGGNRTFRSGGAVPAGASVQMIRM